jgi:hypothetical protein
MKQVDLIRIITQNGAVFIRHGANHDYYKNTGRIFLRSSAKKPGFTLQFLRTRGCAARSCGISASIPCASLFRALLVALRAI